MKLLNKFAMEKYKPVSTPMVMGKKTNKGGWSSQN
jgi:hypothetical protein